MHLTYRFLRLSLALAPAGLAAASCQSETEPGSLVIPVTLGNQKSCAEVGVTSLYAALDDDLEITEVACADDSREIRFDDIDAGRYSLYVAGKNSEGVAVMDSGDQPKLAVEVLGDGATVVLEDPVRLTDAPAHLLVRWDFNFSNCTGSNLGSFRVTAFEEGGSSVLLETTVQCDTTDKDSHGYFAVPDPDRRVKGKLLGEVAVTPLTPSGTSVGNAVLFLFPPPGPGRDVRLSLVECGGSGCSGSGMPDPNP